MLTVKIIFHVNEEKRKEERKGGRGKEEGEGKEKEGGRRKGEPMRCKDLLAELGINVSSTHEICACFQIIPLGLRERVCEMRALGWFPFRQLRCLSRVCPCARPAPLVPAIVS